MDDQGRVLFGYNDGCVSKTCRQSNGAQNDFVAYWTVARQYGGKSLLADFDPVEPAPPEMPYLDGKRNQWNTVLNWRAPNDNGSEITSYQVFRGDSAGNLAQIGSVTGTKRSFVDASQDTGVDVLYYQVVAVNDQGVSEGSNVLGLEVVVEIPEDICLAPGVTTLTDGSGDGVLPGFDMRSFQLSQSFEETGAGHLRFQINTDPGLPMQPVNSFWYVTFYTPDDLVHGVRMIYKESSPSAPVFETYQAGPNSSGAIDGRFVVDGSESAASGSYDYPSGTIVIDVPFSDLGLDAGDLLRGFNGGSVEFAELPTGGGAAHVIDEMPNGLGRSGSQTLSTPEECAGATNQPPVAVLMADPRSGDAPLAVNFDGGASFDPDSGDSVVSYTFDFNDGSAPVTQASPVATHTYENPSNYKPTLTVTDSHGLASNNAAEVVIQVAEPEVITVVDDDDPAVEYTKGWHRRSDPAASDGGYHRRLGATGGGDAPTARLVFEGDEVTYYFGASEDGGSAELYLDGTLRTTIDYSGSAPGKAPEFGREITFSELGEGSHEFLLVFTSGAAYVDGFEVVSGADGGADESAAKTQSETTTSEGQLSLFGASVVSQVVNVGSADEWLSVVVEGASGLLNVSLLNVLGNPVATGGQLLSGASAAGFDMVAPPAGSYMVQVTGSVTSSTSVEISVSRTISVE